MPVRMPSDDQPPIFPPMSFVDRLNASDARRGLPLLTSLDPLAMLLWHQATEWHSQPFLITGC